MLREELREEKRKFRCGKRAAWEQRRLIGDISGGKKILYLAQYMADIIASSDFWWNMALTLQHIMQS